MQREDVAKLFDAQRSLAQREAQEIIEYALRRIEDGASIPQITSELELTYEEYAAVLGELRDESNAILKAALDDAAEKYPTARQIISADPELRKELDWLFRVESTSTKDVRFTRKIWTPEDDKGVGDRIEARGKPWRDAHQAFDLNAYRNAAPVKGSKQARLAREYVNHLRAAEFTYEAIGKHIHKSKNAVAKILRRKG